MILATLAFYPRVDVFDEKLLLLACVPVVRASLLPMHVFRTRLNRLE